MGLNPTRGRHSTHSANPSGVVLEMPLIELLDITVDGFVTVVFAACWSPHSEATYSQVYQINMAT